MVVMSTLWRVLAIAMTVIVAASSAGLMPNRWEVAVRVVVLAPLRPTAGEGDLVPMGCVFAMLGGWVTIASY